jgi:hypothetical protein
MYADTVLLYVCRYCLTFASMYTASQMACTLHNQMLKVTIHSQAIRHEGKAAADMCEKMRT